MRLHGPPNLPLRPAGEVRFWSDEAGKKCLEDIRLHEQWKQENYDFLNKSRSSSFREHSGELWLFFAGGVEWLRFSCLQ